MRWEKKREREGQKLDECGRNEIKGVKIRLTVKGVKTSVNEKYLSTSLITCLLEQVTAVEIK